MKCPYGYTCENCNELDTCDYDPSDEEIAFSYRVDSYAKKANCEYQESRERRKAHYKRYRETKLASAKEYYKKNREKCLAYQKEYQEKNAAVIRAYKKEYYQRNKQKYAERGKLRRERMKGEKEHEII